MNIWRKPAVLVSVDHGNVASMLVLMTGDRLWTIRVLKTLAKSLEIGARYQFNLTGSQVRVLL